MGAFTWGRVAGLAGVGLVAAGAVYLTRTERGRQLRDQAIEKGRELWEKARRQNGSAADALAEPDQGTLATGTGITAEQTA